jgi:hypothetical protein
MPRASAWSAIEAITRRGIGLENLEAKDICVRTVQTRGQTHQEAVIVGFADSPDHSPELADWAQYNVDLIIRRLRYFLYPDEKPVDQEEAARIKRLLAARWK